MNGMQMLVNSMSGGKTQGLMKMLSEFDPEKLKAEWMPRIQQTIQVAQSFATTLERIEKNQLLILERLSNGNTGNPSSGNDSDSCEHRSISSSE